MKNDIKEVYSSHKTMEIFQKHRVFLPKSKKTLSFSRGACNVYSLAIIIHIQYIQHTLVVYVILIFI